MCIGTTTSSNSKRNHDRGKIIDLLITNGTFNSILDIGCGTGDFFDDLNERKIPYNGVGIDFIAEKDVKLETFEYVSGDFNNWDDRRVFDLVFSSHVIEHNPNTETFLKNFVSHTKEGGWFCLIWPPPKPNIVGGHVHTFNMGIMLYNLIRIGVDCSQIKMYKSGYNLCIMGEFHSFKIPELTSNKHEIELLKRYFPFNAEQNFNGDNPPGMVTL